MILITCTLNLRFPQRSLTLCKRPTMNNNKKTSKGNHSSMWKHATFRTRKRSDITLGPELWHYSITVHMFLSLPESFWSFHSKIPSKLMDLWNCLRMWQRKRCPSATSWASHRRGAARKQIQGAARREAELLGGRALKKRGELYQSMVGPST